MSAPPSISHQPHATSLNRALPVLGDWWTVLLIREAFVGVRLFSDSQSRLEIPRQTLGSGKIGVVHAGQGLPRDQFQSFGMHARDEARAHQTNTTHSESLI